MAGERGSTLIEGALALSVVLLLIVGLIDLGQYFYVSQALADRVRTAARSGALSVANGSFDETKVANLVLFGQAEAASAQPSFGLRRSMVTVRRQDAGTAGETVTVAVTGYRHSVVLPLMTGSVDGPAISASAPVR